MKKVILQLVQFSKAGKENAKVSFTAVVVEGEPTNEKITGFLVERLMSVTDIQTSIANKGGKNRLFNITKGGEWKVNVSVETTHEGEDTSVINLISGLEFSFAQLGTDDRKGVLNEIVKGWVLLNSEGTL